MPTATPVIRAGLAGAAWKKRHVLHETHMYILLHGLTLSTRASGRRDAAITSDRLEDTHAC